MPTMLNKLRAQKGLKPLRVDSQLTAIAKKHALDMAKTGNFSHTGSDGSSYQTRMARGGVAPASVETATENIGAGSAAPGVIFTAWTKSGHHTSNITQRNHTRMGVAQAGTFWVAIFAE